MAIECYLRECKYHSHQTVPEYVDLGPICDEDECKNEEIIHVNKLIQKKFKKIRKSCLDFESVS